MRKLNSVERAWCLIGQRGSANAVRSFRVHGRLTPHLMDQALEGVLKVYPVLRCRVVLQGSQLVFRDAPEAPPRVVAIAHALPPDSRSELLQRVEDLLNNPIDPENEPLLQIVHAPISEIEHWILVNFHHAISDGSTKIAFMACFLRLCDAALGSRECFDELVAVEQMKGNLSPSLTDRIGSSGLAYRSAALLRFFGRRMLQEARFRALAPGLERGQSASKHLARCRVFESVYDAVFVERLRNHARAWGLTVNSVVSAAMLKAVKQEIFPLRSRANVSCITFVNLRKRCLPPVPPEAIGCYISAAFSFHAMTDQLFLVELARDLERQLSEASKDDVIAQATAADWMTRTLFALGRTTAATLSVSNIGQVGPQLRSKNFFVSEVHVHSALSGVGSTASVGLTSTERCLSLDMTYLEGVVSHDVIQRLAEFVRLELERFLQTPPVVGLDDVDPWAGMSKPKNKKGDVEFRV